MRWNQFRTIVIDLHRRGWGLPAGNWKPAWRGIRTVIRPLRAGYRRCRMTRKFLTCLAAAAMLPVFSNAGSAAAPCGTRAEIVKKLSEEFKEAPQSVGVVNQDAVVEVCVSENGSWTIIASGTDGKSCVLSSGEDWETNVLAALPDE
jgi:hypothetical protein